MCGIACAGFATTSSAATTPSTRLSGDHRVGSSRRRQYRVVKALLVDDDHDLLTTLSFSLARAGLDVFLAHDVPEALQQLEAIRPEIAVLDVQLGAWSGADLLAQL